MDKSYLEALSRPTIPVPLAGEILGLNRNKSYEAAKAGEIQTLKFGKRLVVPTAWIRRVLGLEAALRQGTSEHEGSDEDAV
jgi:hypothetical protein